MTTYTTTTYPADEIPVLSLEPGDNALTLDLDTLVSTRLLIQGNSGAGKSRAVRSILEQTHGRIQQIVLDPEGEFLSLRDNYDYLLAGEDGDVPATPAVAALLCRKIMDLSVSSVVNLFALKPMERREFVKLFLTELMSLPRELWRPLLVVIDEAHHYIPQDGSAQSAEAVITLCSQGRKRQYCAILATQRLAKLDKDAAAEMVNKLIGRTTQDVDVRRAAEDLGFSKADYGRLKTLQPGQFFAAGPALAQDVTLIQTAPVLTQPPKHGGPAYTPPAASSAVAAMLAQLADLPQQAEDEAKTVEGLRAEIERLRRELSDAPKGKIVEIEKPVTVEKIVDRIVEVPVLQEAMVLRLETTADEMMGAAKDMIAVAQEIKATVDRARREAPPAPAQPVSAVLDPVLPKDEPAAIVQAERPAAPVKAGSGIVSLTLARILSELAALETLGRRSVEREIIAVLAGISPTSGSYSQHLADLRRRGLVDFPSGGMLSLTASGRAQAHVPAKPPTLAKLHDAFVAKVSGDGRKRILRVLIAAYPSVLSRAEVARSVEMSETSGSYSQHLAWLKSFGVIEYPSTGLLKASAILFPKGLS